MYSSAAVCALMVMPRSRSSVHRVEHLRFHFAIAQTAAALDQPVRERGFAVVDMGDDRKVSDVLHQDCDRPGRSGNERFVGTPEAPRRGTGLATEKGVRQ